MPRAGSDVLERVTSHEHWLYTVVATLTREISDKVSCAFQLRGRSLAAALCFTCSSTRPLGLCARGGRGSHSLQTVGWVNWIYLDGNKRYNNWPTQGAGRTPPSFQARVCSDVIKRSTRIRDCQLNSQSLENVTQSVVGQRREKRIVSVFCS